MFNKKKGISNFLKMILIKNRKGGEKLLSLFWFFSLAIIGAGVVLSVLAYHSADVDIREIEADVLYEKIVKCVIEQGFLIDNFEQDNFDIIKECQLNEKTFGEGSSFYFNLRLFDNSSTLIKEIEEGDFSFEKDCEIQEGEEGVTAKNYPRCIRKRENILYYSDNKIKDVFLEILTASNQVGRKVSIAE